MSFSDIEHFATMVSGCESINGGDRTTGDARYAFAVLKLHVRDSPDFGSVVGQEGFLDQVKKGASNTVEFIKKLFEAIKKWFNDTFQSTGAKLKKFLTGTDDEVAKKVAEIRSGMATRVKDIRKETESFPDGVDPAPLNKSADNLLSILEDKTSSYHDFASASLNLITTISKTSRDFSQRCSDLTPSSEDADHGPYNKAVKEYQAFANVTNKFTEYVSSLNSK